MGNGTLHKPLVSGILARAKFSPPCRNHQGWLCILCHNPVLSDFWLAPGLSEMWGFPARANSPPQTLEFRHFPTRSPLGGGFGPFPVDVEWQEGEKPAAPPFISPLLRRSFCDCDFRDNFWNHARGLSMATHMGPPSFSFEGHRFGDLDCSAWGPLLMPSVGQSPRTTSIVGMRTQGG